MAIDPGDMVAAEDMQPAQPARKRSGWEELGRQLGLTARIPAHIATGTAGVLSDALTGLYNEGAERVSPGKGFRFQAVTPALNRLLDQFLPQPETGMERGVQFAGTLFGGGADPLAKGAQKAASSLVPQGFRQVQQSAYNATAKELHDAGLKLLPTQTGGGAATRSLEGAGGVERTNTLLRKANKEPLQALAARATGQQPRNVTAEALDNYSNTIYRQTYEPIKQLGEIRPGRLYRQELATILDEFRSIDQAPSLARRVQELNVTKLPANSVLDQIKHLRKDASDAFAKNEGNYGNALRKIADALENQIERSIPANSPLLEAYRAGRTQIAKNVAVKDMLVDPHTGIIDPTKAQKMLEDGRPLTGELLTIAKAGSPMFNASTRPPIKGEGTPINWGDFLLSGGAGGLGAMTAGPLGLFAAAVPPIMRSGSRHIIASDKVQRAMARNLATPQPPGMLSEIAQRMAIGGMPPLFSTGEQ